MRAIVIGTALLAAAAATPVLAQQLRGGATRRGGAEESRGYEKPVQKEEKRFPVGASWVVISLNGKPFAGTERPTFKLDDEFRVRGYGGCNSFSATAFPLKEQGIAVGPLAMTKRSCDKAVMDTEHAFLTALRTAAKWDTVVGSLTLKGPSGELKLERAL